LEIPLSGMTFSPPRWEWDEKLIVPHHADTRIITGYGLCNFNGTLASESGSHPPGLYHSQLHPWPLAIDDASSL
jgi:hypothetical protein